MCSPTRVVVGTDLRMKIINAVAVLALGFAGCKEKSIIREEVEQGLRQAGAPSSAMSDFNDAIDAKVKEVRAHAKYATAKAAMRAELAKLKTADFEAEAAGLGDVPADVKDSAKAVFNRLRNLKTVDFDDMAAMGRITGPAGSNPEVRQSIERMRAHGMKESDIADIMEVMGLAGTVPKSTADSIGGSNIPWLDIDDFQNRHGRFSATGGDQQEE